LSGIDFVTAGLSHELVEASTDPFYLSGPAYLSPPSVYNDWNFATGGELADMCTTTTAVYFKPTDFPYMVQRSWSNMAASADNDPCVPAPAGPYFGAAPVLPDTVHGNNYGQLFTSEGAHIALGSSTTLEVDLFSDAPTDPFTVTATTVGAAQLSFLWDTKSGQNGDKLNLTVTRNADDPNITGADFFIIVASQGTRESAWVGAVGN
jgi:hypothetical protein